MADIVVPATEEAERRAFGENNVKGWGVRTENIYLASAINPREKVKDEMVRRKCRFQEAASKRGTCRETEIPTPAKPTLFQCETGTPETERAAVKVILEPSTFHSSDKAKAAKLMHQANSRRDA
jgi:hypothetical protein